MVKQPKPVASINTKSNSLQAQMKQLDQVAKRLETQADALEQQPKYGGYYRQQVRMRRMVIQEVKALQEKMW